jgi:cell division protein FtsA
MSSQKNSQNEKVRRVIGIDIGSAFLRAAVVKNGHLENFYEEPSEGVSYGVVVDEKLFQAALDNLLAKIAHHYKTFPNEVVVALGGLGQNSTITRASVFTSRADGLITDIDIDKILEEAEKRQTDLESKVILHAIPNKIWIDGNLCVGSPINNVGKKIEAKILFIYDNRKQKDLIVKAFKKSGIDINEIVSGPLADAHVSLSKREKSVGAAAINIGYSNTSVLVYEENSPILCSVIKGGGENITTDLSLGLRLPLQEAEQIKVNGSEMGKRRVEEIVEARLFDFSHKINDELARINRNELLPGGVVLLGGTSLLSKIEYFMRYELKVLASNALKNFYQKEKEYNIDDPRFIRCYGATFFGKDFDESDFFIKIFKNAWRSLSDSFRKFLP